jgi:hypothetical protein
MLGSSGEDALNLRSAQGPVENAYIINIAVEPQFAGAGTVRSRIAFQSQVFCK